MRRRAAAAVAAIAMLAAPVAASESGSPDYASAADWVCRPGAEAVCTTGLDATVVGRDGAARPLPFAPARDPAIDCFYVYPTVSRERSDYSDLAASPEIARVVNAQAGRLSARCRVFAPVYRQATLAHLRRVLAGDDPATSDAPMRDVEAAWSFYLAHDNGGRGVALVGHSQGTILLQRLIASRIDGAPAQRLLVAAFLAGDPSLAVPDGRLVGGTFAHVPLCTSAPETGCAYAWGSYLAGDTSRHAFGRPLGGGMTSACVSPAAPGGGSGALESFDERPPEAPDSDPPWIESVGRLSGACRTDAAGSGFYVTVEPGPRADADRALLERSERVPGWGLHPRDVDLVQGNILDVLAAESAAWTAAHAPGRTASETRR